MKKDIHPQWYPQARVTCACGNTFTVGSTKPEFRIELCSRCHPFFTGQQKFVDAVGRIERFRQKQAAAKPRPLKKKATPQPPESPKTLKEMLTQKS